MANRVFKVTVPEENLEALADFIKDQTGTFLDGEELIRELFFCLGGRVGDDLDIRDSVTVKEVIDGKD